MLRIRNLVSVASVALAATLGVILPSIKGIHAQQSTVNLIVCYDGRRNGTADIEIQDLNGNSLTGLITSLSDATPAVSHGRNGNDECPGKSFVAERGATYTIEAKYYKRGALEYTVAPETCSFTINNNAIEVEIDIERNEVDIRQRVARGSERLGKEVCGGEEA
ncbi:MAG: hypothetical protein AAFX01_06820 [Cyanobacteria bacterium J06638_28]